MEWEPAGGEVVVAVGGGGDVAELREQIQLKK